MAKLRSLIMGHPVCSTTGRPCIICNLLALVWLQKAAPSPSVRWSVVNLLAAYAVTTRVYNGDHHSAALEASATLVGLCASLGANQLFEGPELAVAAVHLAAVDVRLCRLVVGRYRYHSDHFSVPFPSVSVSFGISTTLSVLVPKLDFSTITSLDETTWDYWK